MPDQTKPSPIKSLLGSRKTVAAFLYSILAIASILAARWGLNFDPTTASTTALPWVILGLSHIFGIAYEDGQAKSAGVGSTTTAAPTADGGVTKTVDPTGTV